MAPTSLQGSDFFLNFPPPPQKKNRKNKTTGKFTEADSQSPKICGQTSNSGFSISKTTLSLNCKNHREGRMARRLGISVWRPISAVRPSPGRAKFWKKQIFIQKSNPLSITIGQICKSGGACLATRLGTVWEPSGDASQHPLSSISQWAKLITHQLTRSRAHVGRVSAASCMETK